MAILQNHFGVANLFFRQNKRGKILLRSFYLKGLSLNIFRMTDPDFCIENYVSLGVFNLKGEVILTKNHPNG